METTASKSKSSDTEGSGIRVIARAADILLTLSNHPNGLSLREIARFVGQPRSTVQRIVSALEEANLVIAASAASGFRLGPTLTLLAAAVRPFDIVSMARPLILQLASESGETIDLSIFAHGKAVVVDQISGTHPLLAVSAIGSSLPLHATSIGKVLLAALPEKELDALRKHMKLDALTPNTTTSWDKLNPELDEIRATGISYDNQEYMTGICSVATLLRGPGGEIAAVSFPVPTGRYKEVEEKLIGLLKDRAQSLQRRL